MKKLALNLMAVGVSIIVASACANNVAATTYAIPISGLPFVTVNPNATLNPEQGTSLSALIDYNPGNPQCNFVDTVTGALVSTAPCSIAYSVLLINPNSSYTIDGAYVNQLGEITGVIGGADPAGLRPDYSAMRIFLPFW